MRRLGARQRHGGPVVEAAVSLDAACLDGVGVALAHDIVHGVERLRGVAGAVEVVGGRTHYYTGFRGAADVQSAVRGVACPARGAYAGGEGVLHSLRIRLTAVKRTGHQ